MREKQSAQSVARVGKVLELRFSANVLERSDHTIDDFLEHAEREVEQVCARRIVSLNTRRCPAKRAKAEACHLEGADHAGEEGHSKGGQSERGTGSALMSCPFTESRYEDVLAFYMKAITDRPTVRPSDIFPSRFQSRRCIEVVNQSICQKDHQ